MENKEVDNLVSKSHLMDWHIHSVLKNNPDWTVEHIDELCNDFNVCFKEEKNKEFVCLLGYQCSQLNIENDKLLEKNAELKQQLKAKDKALDKAYKTLTEKTYSCPYESYNIEPRGDCRKHCKNGMESKCWKELCENGTD